MTASDKLFMLRALELASAGAGCVRPNPMVGCVIVHNDQIIGEGWHQKYGGPHAEVNAINSVKDKSLLKESTVYVTLEPCSHFGKTPPCADLLIKSKVKRVIICNHDPNPLVAGRGIYKLQQAGIEVRSSFLAENGSVLNRRFFTFHQKKRPYIVLKWAQTADGFIARSDYEQVSISGPQAKNLVHKWRAEEAAIMVGTRTALFDNPQLNVRAWKGSNPIRIIIDKNLSLPKNLFVFNNSQPTIIFNLHYDQVMSENLELIKLETNKDFLIQMLNHLHSRSIDSILVEGGSTLLKSFIMANLWDEARILRNFNFLNSGIPAPFLPLNSLTHTQRIGEDQLFIHHNLNH